MSKTLTIKLVLVIIIAAIIIISAVQFYTHRHYQLPIVAGPGVTRVVKLSDYCKNLAGTAGDTNVFFLEGKAVELSLLKSIIHAVGAGVGFTIAMLLMSGIRERLELADIPQSFKGAAIAFITAGLMSMAFLGFAGIVPH